MSRPSSVRHKSPPVTCSTSPTSPGKPNQSYKATEETSGNSFSLPRLRHGAMRLHVPSLPVSPGSSVASDLQRLYSWSWTQLVSNNSTTWLFQEQFDQYRSKLGSFRHNYLLGIDVSVPVFSFLSLWEAWHADIARSSQVAYIRFVETYTIGVPPLRLLLLILGQVPRIWEHGHLAKFISAWLQRQYVVNWVLFCVCIPISDAGCSGNFVGIKFIIQRWFYEKKMALFSKILGLLLETWRPESKGRRSMRSMRSMLLIAGAIWCRPSRSRSCLESSFDLCCRWIQDGGAPTLSSPQLHWLHLVTSFMVSGAFGIFLIILHVMYSAILVNLVWINGIRQSSQSGELHPWLHAGARQLWEGQSGSSQSAAWMNWIL